MAIYEHINKYAENLSGGNKRKLQTAIAILGNPLVILLDEPSAGMDPGARRFMWRIVSNIIKERPLSCVILTTHSMEEADALSTKMGILVQGGIFKCFGTSQHIKDKFGAGYEMEWRLAELDQEKSDQMLREFSLDKKEGEYSLSELVKIAKASPDFEKSCLEMIFNINFQNHSAATTMLSAEEFIGYLHAFRCKQAIISRFNHAFGEVHILESYGKDYFKIRIPKNRRSLGFMYGFIENHKDDSWGVLEYSVSQTTLEMIFNKIA